MTFLLQFARTISCACSNPNVRPDACDRQLRWRATTMAAMAMPGNSRAWIGACGYLIPAPYGGVKLMVP